MVPIAGCAKRQRSTKKSVASENRATARWRPNAALTAGTDMAQDMAQTWRFDLV
jgi:hypothetical protein